MNVIVKFFNLTTGSEYLWDNDMEDTQKECGWSLRVELPAVLVVALAKTASEHRRKGRVYSECTVERKNRFTCP